MEKTGKREKGVTLIELMIVLVIAAVLVGGVYTLFATQQRSYSVQDQVTGVQQDARAALDIMARDIRMAGGLVGRDGFNVNGAQFAITPTLNGGSGGTDSITVVYGAEEFLSSTGDPVTVANVDSAQKKVTLTADDGIFDATDGDLFDTDKKKYVAFGGDDTVYVISSIPSDETLTLTASPPAYLQNVGARVFLVKAITYSISGDMLSLDDHINPVPQPLAGDGITTVVEDLQFAYQVAGSDDWIYDEDTLTWPAGSDNADIRMVRINITVRTGVEDATVQDADAAARFDQPIIEDHNTGLKQDDGFRRRVYTTVVKARNL